MNAGPVRISHDDADWGNAARAVRRLSESAQEAEGLLGGLPEFYAKTHYPLDEVTPATHEQWAPLRALYDGLDGLLSALGRSHEDGAHATINDMSAAMEDAESAAQGFANGGRH